MCKTVATDARGHDKIRKLSISIRFKPRIKVMIRSFVRTPFKLNQVRIEHASRTLVKVER